MDSNHGKEIQSLSCYPYTIGQCELTYYAMRIYSWNTKLVHLVRFERTTPRLSSECSNQLSYKCLCKQVYFV